jgi:exopolysaccharide biosynthesis polyprenyl glycosylphosphotransferase
VGAHLRRDTTPAHDRATWASGYLRWAGAADCGCALAAGLLAFEIRFDGRGHGPTAYLIFSLCLPLLWVASVALAGGYDSRFIGLGSDEFRRIMNAGVGLTAAVAIASYATRSDLARGYVVIALPATTLFDLLARYALRKRLHRLRGRGRYLHRVVVVGHAPVVTDLAAELARSPYHGLSVVAACVVGPPEPGGAEIAGVPAVAGLGHVPEVVERFHADTVAVLACPEMSGARLRELAWELEKTHTDLCVAPALLDVAGPRTTIRPVAGLPLLHMDHPEFTGARRLIKTAFDRALVVPTLLLLGPLFAIMAVIIRCSDGGPAFFRQVRVGREGRTFTLYKFRTMVPDAEARREQLAALNETDAVLFKIRRDPRVTRVGAWLRRWSLDELPQLINVLLGDMSLVGPRPALPREAALYGHHVRRRLMVKPGITGLWQVSGRADLSWDESVRLDLRYVENWSLVLDLQILWKTVAAVLRGSGAYLSAALIGHANGCPRPGPLARCYCQPGSRDEVLGLGQGLQDEPPEQPPADNVFRPVPPQVQPGAALGRHQHRNDRPDGALLGRTAPALGQHVRQQPEGDNGAGRTARGVVPGRPDGELLGRRGSPDQPLERLLQVDLGHEAGGEQRQGCPVPALIGD